MPRRPLSTWLLLAGLIVLPCRPLTAADAPKPAEPPLPADSVTSHTMTLRGREITYTATAGTLPLTNQKGDKTAEVFYVAYTVNGADPATRPITFALNGGPGAGSAYLHIGAIGPRALEFDTGRALPFTDGKLIDNPDTWLDLTDLVFVDPVGTGYSRATVGEDEAQKEFWGVRQDLRALGTIARLALAHLDRVASPVHLVGESYGGFRAAELPAHLAESEGIAVAGAVLVSPVLEFSLMEGDLFNPMPWALRLPSYTAVNLETQGKLAPAALADAERFALGDYASALIAPPHDHGARDLLYGRIASLIGLPDSVIARWRGRVPLGVFVKEIRHGQDELVSRYDGSVAVVDPYPSSYTPESGDPVLEGLTAPLTTAFVTYLREELRYKTDRRYNLLNGEVSGKWEWGDHGGRHAAGASDDLRKALALNPRLKVVIAHGMTDLQTPYLASRYVVDHLPERLTQDRVTLKLYEGGHMMYLRRASRAQLHADARAVYGLGAE